MAKRVKTKYPGVFYRTARRIGRKGTERVYYVVFKRNGKTIEEKAGRQFKDDMTPAKAAKYRADRIEGIVLSRKEVREQEEERKRAEENRWTIDRLWNEYLSQRGRFGGQRSATFIYNKYIKGQFGNMEPHEILPLDADRLRINLSKKLAPQSVKHVLSILMRIIRFGERKGLSHGLNFAIDMPRVENEKTEDLSPEQLKKLLNAIKANPDNPAGPMMKLALYTGMRRGEMFKLKWEDIDFKAGFIHLRNPKGGKDQKIPLNNAARTLLEEHPQKRSPYVFPARGGGKRSCIHRQAKAIKDAAGLPKDFRPLHGLRHVYASMLASSGKVDMYTLQKLLTHKSPVMTQRYAHLRDDALRRASDVASEIITAATTEAEAGEDKVVSLDDSKR